MKIAQVEEDLLSRGIIDDKKIYTYATNAAFGSGFVGGMAAASAGMSVYCIFCIKDDVFSVYGAKMNNEITQLEFTCKLSEMTDFEFRPTPPGFSVLKFKAKGNSFKFTNFKNGKIFVDSFRSAKLIK